MPGVESKEAELIRLAEELYVRKPSWVDFFREIFGWNGAVMRAFPDADERECFRESEEYAHLNEMLDELREQEEDNPRRREPVSTITVRLPRSLHESLLEEAAEGRMSLNRLCILKLTQVLGVQPASGRVGE